MDDNTPELISALEDLRKRVALLEAKVFKLRKPRVLNAAPAITDTQWLGLLRNDYPGVDVDQEYVKMRNWCIVNGKQPSRKRFVNWLNRCEKPMQAPANAVNNGSPPVANGPIWLQIRGMEALIAAKIGALPGVANRTLYPAEYEQDVKAREAAVAEIKQLRAKLTELRGRIV